MDLQRVRDMVARSEAVRQRIADEVDAALGEDPCLNFGRHRGMRCSEVPFGYLAWCADKEFCPPRVRDWYMRHANNE